MKPGRIPILLIVAGTLLIVSAGFLILPTGGAAPLEWKPASGDDGSGPEGLPQLNSVTPAQVSFPAPALELVNLDLVAESLSDYLGQVVLINNWAIWCPPCKAELPHLEEYYQRHKDEGFTIIAIEGGGRRAEVAAYVEAYQLTFPVWLDPGELALETFGAMSIPASYVMDRDGQIRFAWVGTISVEMLETYLTPMLK